MKPKIEEILSPNLEWERFIHSLTPEQKAKASSWISGDPNWTPRNPLAQIQIIKATLNPQQP